MLTPGRTTAFAKDLARACRRGCDLFQFIEVTLLLLNEMPLPRHYRDHALGGKWVNHRELHIAPDWLLVYMINKAENSCIFVRMGTHSELFD